MKILNLVYPEKSDIKYKIHKFPDGQQNITIEDEGYEEDITIKSRLNNFLDLELIICARKALQCNGYYGCIHLHTPYFLGSRSDRHFGGCSNNYLRDVICPIINSLNFKSVTVLDPHSDVLEACLKGFRKQSNFELVKFFLKDKSYPTDIILMSPDAGATKKIYKIADQIAYKGDVITCSKDRDKDGKLTKTVIPTFVEPAKKDIIIIDDICDGGATFINISKAIKESWHNNKIHLIVTHGIFSKGFSELSQHFDSIYCTNSYSDLQAVSFESNSKGNHKVMTEKLVKQLNVF